MILKCEDCTWEGPNLWLCLYKDCLRVGCGEAQNDHSIKHNKLMPTHSLNLNLSTMRVWCYICEQEIFLDNNDPPVPWSGHHAVSANPASHYAFLHSSRSSNGCIGNAGGVPCDSESSDSDESGDDNSKPRGLTGLQNIGNTCYMNSALQALSNTPPLTQFFLECSGSVARAEKKPPGLSRNYLRLIQEMWHKRRPGYVVPSGILYGIRNVHPMFRGYQQHDTQEFLRCFMDQLHEELKEPVVERPGIDGKGLHNRMGDGTCSPYEDVSDEEGEDEEESREEEAAEGSKKGSCGGRMRGDGMPGMLGDGSARGEASSQSEGEEYETCDSGVSEQSSLSDEGERHHGGGGQSDCKHKLSRSPSPPTNERVRSKLAATAHCQSIKGASQGSPTRSARKKQLKYRSIISDVFDGKVLSSVQCLTCDRISTRVETFQDLSLPIPSRDHIHMLHQGSLTPQKGVSACADVYGANQGWLLWVLDWIRRWFLGPTVSLHDCLAAFFSADELKGDNMYSCEKCNKLRNGVKYSKVLELPEILCIHLKRFRHELMFSSKISSYVSFPLEGLDMRPYLHKDCTSEVTTYDLSSVICHHGTAGGGHYTCYSLNCISDQWFEFDDQYVTEVSPEVVQNCEAYVLFYKKSSEEVNRLRLRTVELMELSKNEPGLMEFYVSKQWVNRFNTFAEPGPIDNSDFLCAHGGVHPSKAPYVFDLCTPISQSVWEYLYETFGGGPACNRLYECSTCQAEQEALQCRIEQELEEFLQLKKDFQAEESPTLIYAIAMSWFRQWHGFVKGKEPEPPGAIDNTSIITTKNGVQVLKLVSDYAQLSEEQWRFFHRIYGGGPEVMVRQGGLIGRSVPPIVGTPGAAKFNGNNSFIPAASSLSDTSSGIVITGSFTGSLDSASSLKQTHTNKAHSTENIHHHSQPIMPIPRPQSLVTAVGACNFQNAVGLPGRSLSLSSEGDSNVLNAAKKVRRKRRDSSSGGFGEVLEMTQSQSTSSWSPSYSVTSEEGKAGVDAMKGEGPEGKVDAGEVADGGAAARQAGVSHDVDGHAAEPMIVN
ncbi:ubiquitin carboxyl-terminal hydrolase 20 isoform X2 [Ischnura elegans]|uniref:ubiquitin carboxyl-terminal hydrolase 20 isoform X2 n=1 Tax=Ischnura elegans TaxID=197161 RepID=UPI001ED8A85F|nr:ubiquitin carboxyl-terminal hydrolase 20 isoform X2 [Ischnura elegans]